jgi:DNA polymerase-3 subunit beta
MKLTVNRKVLAEALKTATVVSTTASMPILNCLHLRATKDGDAGQLAITGTNLDLTVTTVVDGVNVERPGEVLLPGKTLRPLIEKASADIVEITLDAPGDEAMIEAGGTATLRTADLNSWPQMTVADGQRFELTGPDIDRLARMLHAASKNDTRPALTGVHFDGDRVHVTDSYRLAVATLTGANLPDKIVPAAAVARAATESPFGLGVSFDARSATFHSDDGLTSWTSRVIEAAYPNVDRLITDEMPFELVVAREPLVEAVKWVSLVADDGSRVGFSRDGDVLSIAAADAGVGDAVKQIDCSGTWEQGITINFKYLLETLNVFDDDELRIEFSDPRKPLQLRYADGLLVFALMPISG